MNIRAGDILVWRATMMPDLLTSYLVQLPGLHSGLILKGEKICQFSKRKSPTDTYITFLKDVVLPFEEVIYQLWRRPNCIAVYLVHRYDGPDIDEDLQYKILNEYLSYEKYNPFTTTYQVIAAYFRWGHIWNGPIKNNKRYHTCINLIGYLLYHFKLMKDKSIINNLLPVDIYNLTFMQIYNYVRIEIFDKKLDTMSWYLHAFLLKYKLIKVKKYKNKYVNLLVGNYNYESFKFSYLS
ncbi:MAG: hypothetical protein QW478_01670 [Candidatus Micrarchaeaceae archaeon]